MGSSDLKLLLIAGLIMKLFMVSAMAMEDTDSATATEAMVDTVWATTERERPRLRLVMVRTGAMATGVMATVDMDTEDTEPEDTIMARGRPRPRPVMARTGDMATGPEVTTVMAMDTVSTTDKKSDENCQSSIEFR